MKVALIAPIDMLDLVADYNTHYHLVLPDQMMRSKVYRDFYREIDGYKILDNGAAEGTVFDHTELHTLASDIGADEIVVPDSLGDFHRTVEYARSFKPWARIGATYKYVGVLQGQNPSEVLGCLNYFELEPWVSSVMIPRCTNRIIHKAFREEFLQAMQFNRDQTDKPYRFDQYHCLGASEWVREVASLSDKPIVRGIDTSLPFSMGLARKSMTAGDDYVGRQRNFFDIQVNRASLEWGVISDNVKRYLDWANCDYGASASG